MKDKFLIKGLNGKRTLSGTIRIGGAKNSALKLMAATLLFGDEVKIKNIPEIEDVHRTVDLLKDLGSIIEKKGKGVYTFKTNKKSKTDLSSTISKRMRASIVLTGPILSRFGEVSFPHPGGCVIGERPIDMFIEGFKKMGATVQIKKGKYIIKAKGDKLQGADFFMRVPSVTGTETFMMAAVLAKGTTIIRNAALEPEIKDLADFLNKRGAHISGAGTTSITIKGGALLKSKKKVHTVMPDRIDAGSFLILGALAAKKLTITNCEPKHLESLIDTLRRANISIDVRKTSITVMGQVSKLIKPVNVKTHEYPGFPTDLQALITVLLTQANGESLLFETIYESRLGYTDSLLAMGADILIIDAHRILIKGSKPLHGRVLESPDLRAGLAFIIAAIIAKGESVIHNVYNIERGYEQIENRLRNIGVDIKRVNGG